MIRFDDVTVSYQDETVLEGVNLRVPAGAHIALMSPSGCGKTSLLQLAAGLLSPVRGSVQVRAERVAYVFQEPRLLPSRTALQNVNAVLGDRKTTLSQAAEWLELVGLGDAGDKLPRELSGGMRQRVNIARALAFQGDLLLMDEPFQGIDGDRREDLIALIRDSARYKTLLLATHDRAEAEALCDRIFVYANKTFHQ